MRLNGSAWVDHPEHGDRDERSKRDDNRATPAVSRWCGDGALQTWAGRYALCAYHQRAATFRGPHASGARSVSPGFIPKRMSRCWPSETDALHSTLSGPATCILMRRAIAVYGDVRYEHLAGLSVGPPYNLSKRSGYRWPRCWTNCASSWPSHASILHRG